MGKSGYYQEKLAAENLKRCYEIAPPRVKQYFSTEISYVLDKIKPNDKVLDLGCGFGRVMPEMAQKAATVVGIDHSFASLILAKKTTAGIADCFLVGADGLYLSFKSNSFDVVACIQNGISAFHVDQKELIKESIRVTKRGGTVLFSSYSDKFWDHRLEWFHMQADEGLLGEIDEEKTRNGVIICKDGFTAATVSPGRFLALTSGLGVAASIHEVDESSVFCKIIV